MTLWNKLFRSHKTSELIEIVDEGQSFITRLLLLMLDLLGLNVLELSWSQSDIVDPRADMRVELLVL
jgi:hypothetical protein